MTGSRSFSSTCARVLVMLDSGYLRLRNVVVKRIAVTKFGVNDGDGSGKGADTMELKNVIRFGER